MPSEARFRVGIADEGPGPLVRASVAGKDDLFVATPPEFPGGIAGVWSPEDLLVGAVASCFGVTLHAVAKHRGIPLHRVDVDALGVVGRPPEGGGYRFTAIELTVEIETDPEQVSAAEHAAGVAESACLVTRSLDTPVRLAVKVTGAALPVTRAPVLPTPTG